MSHNLIQLNAKLLLVAFPHAFNSVSSVMYRVAKNGTIIVRFNFIKY